MMINTQKQPHTRDQIQERMAFIESLYRRNECNDDDIIVAIGTQNGKVLRARLRAR